MTRLAVAADQRYRPYMEDRAVTGAVAGGVVAGVFDGHGGAAVADRAAASALTLIEQALAANLRGEAFWRQVFAGLDVNARGCGSTATLVLVRERDLSVAWVGDSRAVLVTAAAWRILTPDHRIEREDERQRVIQAGALIVPPYVVDPRTEHGVMMTRALGDRELRRVGVTAEPEVAALPIEEDDVGFVLATDGLWDVVANDEAASVCRQADPQPAAKWLVELVSTRDGADNVTVVVGRF